jgi:hypothetical protein
MTEVLIDGFDASIELKSDASGAQAASGVSPTGDALADAARLRELLRPIILDVLEDELSLYTRMRG